MTTLQSYRGQGKSSKKTYYRIQPYLADGSRPTIRLGCGKKQAQVSADAIMDLIDSQSAGVEPKTDTKKWIENTASKPICMTLLKCKLIEALPNRFKNTNATTLSQMADEHIKTRCAGLDEATIEINLKAKRNLLDCFGDVNITSLKKKDGREFWRWLLEDEGLGENTAKQRLRYARAFYELAIEDELVGINPFKARGLSVTQTAAEKEYVEKTTVEKVLKKCPTLEWKFLFALTRKVPVRIPSEIQDFTWTDVDWKKNQMLIHSPKTRHLGKSARLVPIFESLKPYLIELRQSQNSEEEFVFPVLRKNTNPGTNAKRIVKSAGVKVWINFFNSIRASAETDLMDEYGLRRACQWAGNSAATAMKNYALVKKTDFDDSGENQNQKSDAKSDAILEIDAKSDAEPASNASQPIAKNPKKKALPIISTENSAFDVGGTGPAPLSYV